MSLATQGTLLTVTLHGILTRLQGATGAFPTTPHFALICYLPLAAAMGI